MKTIFTLFSSLILSAAVMAAPVNKDTRPKSALTIRSADRGDIRVIIDGRRFEPNDNYLRVQGMESGYHNVKVYQEKNSGIFSIFGKRYEIVFNSSIALKPFTNVTLSVDRFGRTTMNEERTRGGRFGRGGRGWDKDHDFQFDNGGNSGDYDNDHDGPRGGGGFGGYDNGHDGRADQSHNGGYGYNNVMNDFEFDRVLGSINKEWFESNKVKSATQIIQSNNFTSIQVKQLLGLFSFENNKLDLAKLAYTKTVDQKNYFLINEVFSFNSSKDELARYIRSCD